MDRPIARSRKREGTCCLHYVLISVMPIVCIGAAVGVSEKFRLWVRGAGMYGAMPLHAIVFQGDECLVPTGGGPGTLATGVTLHIGYLAYESYSGSGGRKGGQSHGRRV